MCVIAYRNCKIIALSGSVNKCASTFLENLIYMYGWEGIDYVDVILFFTIMT